MARVSVMGIDFAYGPLAAASIRAAGYRFACRYVSNRPGNPKNLTREEAAALRAAGLDVVVVFEHGATRPLLGSAAGSVDGHRAREQADAAGAPPGSAIYAAIDFDVQPDQLDAVRAYLDGFGAAVAPHPAGVYGGWRAMYAAENLRRVRYRWQAAAWAYGRGTHPDAHLRQHADQVVIDGVPCDVNTALAADYGGWAMADPGGRMATLDKDDLDSIEKTMRRVLNEGAGKGQQNWAGTSAAVLAAVQAAHNDLADLKQLLGATSAGSLPTATVQRALAAASEAFAAALRE
jgi:hypothetical protein